MVVRDGGKWYPLEGDGMVGSTDDEEDDDGVDGHGHESIGRSRAFVFDGERDVESE